jgi:hypothetical protein
VAAVGDDDIWFFQLSTITLRDGKVAAWTQYDPRLPMNIGRPASIPTAAGPGRSPQQVVAALGTPDAVVGFENGQLWFYGMNHLVFYQGRVTRWEEVPGAQAADRSRILRASSGSEQSGAARDHGAARDATSAAYDPAKPTVSQLWSAYMGNVLAADAAYTGKTLTLEGFIGSVDRDINGAPYVLLIPSADVAAFGVRCQFGRDDESKLRPLKSGQSAKIRGKCEGRSGTDVLLTDCTLQP